MMISRSGSLVLLGGIAAMLVGGTFGLLFTNHPVPDYIVALDAAAVSFLYGHGNFLATNAAHQATVNSLMDAVSTGASAAGSQQTGTGNGEGTATAGTTKTAPEVR